MQYMKLMKLSITRGNCQYKKSIWCWKMKDETLLIRLSRINEH